jgi:uncharacterized protein (DUF58 family)
MRTELLLPLAVLAFARDVGGMRWLRPNPTPPPPSDPAATVAGVLADVRRFEVHTSRFVTDVLAGGYRSTFRGAGVEFSDVREYVEGDDPRLVDWNVSARVGRPFVKRFVEERELTLLFALDLSASMAAGTGAWSLREAAARFVAVLGLAAIANHDRVGLLAGGGAPDGLLPPKKGAGQVWTVVERCLRQAPGQPGTDLGSLLAEAAGRLRRRAVVILLSDFQTALPDRVLRTCARRHDLVAVHLLPHELLQPPAALCDLADPETGALLRLDFAAAAVRTAWQARVARWRQQLADQLHRAGVDRIDLELPFTADATAVVNPLLRFFRRRELRQVRR